MQKAMSWAQLYKVKWKSRAGRKLGDSYAPGPLTCSHLCDPSPSLPWRSEPPERPRQLTAAKTNFPRGDGRIQGACPPPNHYLYPLPSTGEPTNRVHPHPPPRRISSKWESDGMAHVFRAVELSPKGSGVQTAGAAENPSSWQTLRGCWASRSEGRVGVQGMLRSSHFSPCVGQQGGLGLFFSGLGFPEIGAHSQAGGASSAPEG